MGHLALILFVMAFALGATALGLSLVSYTQTRTPAKKHFALFLLAFNLLPLINYANLYLLTNFTVNSDSFEYLVFYQVLCFAGSGAKLFWVVFFVFFILSSVQKDFGRGLKRLIVLAALAATVTFTAAHAWIQFGGSALSPHLVGAAIDLVTFLPLTWTLLLSRHESGSASKRWRFIVSVANYAVFCLILASRILHYLAKFSLDDHLLISFLLTVPMNIAALLFLRATTRIGAIPSGPTAFAADCSLSKRETEIAPLVCQGKTNREIGEELFISLQTVKDHVYRIFRKTGARNRVELTNAIRGTR